MYAQCIIHELKVKAKRIKKDYVKELAELHVHNPNAEEDEERDTLPDMNHPRMSRRASKVCKPATISLLSV